MPRIRTIKPEYWCDEKLSALGPIDRLVFLGLISLADDYGRVHDNEKVIDAFIFPSTSDSVRESLAKLSGMVRIRRGKASSGMPIIEIVNWSKHQRVDKPQPRMALPPIAAIANENVDATPIRESIANDSGMVRDFGAPRPTTTDQLTPTNELRPTSNEPNTNRNSFECEKPKTKFDPKALEIPLALQVDSFKRAWIDWCDHRCEIKHSLKEKQAEKQLEQFEQWGVARSVAAINHTITQGWQGIREPDIDARQAPGQQLTKGQQLAAQVQAMKAGLS